MCVFSCSESSGYFYALLRLLVRCFCIFFNKCIDGIVYTVNRCLFGIAAWRVKTDAVKL